MKRFLYYDEDSVNSFLAQIEQGLVTQDRKEDAETTSSSNTSTIADSVTGDLSAKIFGIGASLNGDIEASMSESDATSNLVKGVKEKVLHDYAFDKIFKYFQSENMIVATPDKIGDIVLLNETPTFLDFDYFQRLFSEDGVIKYSDEQNRNKVQNAISETKKLISNGSQLTPDQRAQIPEWKLEIKKLEDKLKKTASDRKDTERIINVIRNTIPYNRAIMTEEILIPCDDSKFRDDPGIVAFKYGGNISILGYITNIITSDDYNSENNNVFAALYSSLNQVMLGLFEGKKQVYILHPIAMYY